MEKNGIRVEKDGDKITLTAENNLTVLTLGSRGCNKNGEMALIAI